MKGYCETLEHANKKKLNIAVPAFQENHQTRLYIAQVIFLLGIFVKQFYILPSGKLQAGDLLMMIGCVLYVCIVKKGRITMTRNNWWFFAFFLCVLLINSLYYIRYMADDLLYSTAYYLFNLVIIVVFTELLQEPNRNTFLRSLGIVLKVSLVIQAGLYVLGLGNWQDAWRYIGTFHDPNQFGVFIFFSMLMIYLCDHVTHNRWWVLWSLFGTITVFPSASTGTMLGIVLFWTGMYFSNVRSMKKIWRFVYGFLTALFVLMFLVFGLGVVQLPPSITSHFMYIRIVRKLEMIMGGGDASALLSDRVWDRVVEYPIYFLYGSGEGYHYRFDEFDYELHSSILGPAFCYGIVPFLILCTWVFKTIGHSRYLFIYVAMFAEALFVVNTRQPMYWMLMLMGTITLKPKFEEIQREKWVSEASKIWVLGKLRKKPEAATLRG